MLLTGRVRGADENDPTSATETAIVAGRGKGDREDGNAERQRHRLNSRTPSSPSYSRPPPVTGESRDRERPKASNGRADGRTDLSGLESVSQSVGLLGSLGARREATPRLTHTYNRAIYIHTGRTQVSTYTDYSCTERKPRRQRSR